MGKHEIVEDHSFNNKYVTLLNNREMISRIKYQTFPLGRKVMYIITLKIK